jgi:hypothetical protein
LNYRFERHFPAAFARNQLKNTRINASGVAGWHRER